MILDASAVTALLLDEPSAETFAELLRSERVRISTVNVAEIVDVLVRVRKGSPDEVIGRVEELVSTLVVPAPPSLELAIRAGELRARHFRRDQRVSLADCFLLATVTAGETIVTTDSVLADVAGAEGLSFLLLAA